MFKSITIKDFLNHASRVIEFDPHVTCIVGRTRAGKSAIITAIGWVATNQPSGNSMIRHGRMRAMAKLELDDCVVVRKKGKTNTYLLDGKKYKAFGAGKVPDEITKALRLDPVNFQRQFDGHFWLSDSAGEVSRQLNRIVDLGVIDSSVAKAQSELRSAKAEKEVCEKRLESTEKEMEELAWVPKMIDELQRLEHRQMEIDELKDSLEELESAITILEEADNQIKEAERMLMLLTPVLFKLESLAQAKTDRNMLRDLITDLEECELLDTPDFCKLHLGMDRLRGLGSERIRLEMLVGEIEWAGEEIDKWESRVTVTKQEIQELTGGRCPLCGSPSS